MLKTEKELREMHDYNHKHHACCGMFFIFKSINKYILLALFSQRNLSLFGGQFGVAGWVFERIITFLRISNIGLLNNGILFLIFCILFYKSKILNFKIYLKVKISNFEIYSKIWISNFETYLKIWISNFEIYSKI